ncbi:hypothetical protein [Deinococcus soli (ex Cha et al. 2016)]|uniref:Uncharacterized protein n=2 Tax=Deinococcus soli (ex Cha et al. 2016) TaxID=1309411 RepID=A0AAE3XBT3_9DEIO|nr:hypothetical protein [Deinococcus soli (ex Cha et al. 2016)]MDR6218607.1 hypothetical protein [Deinococcus soli (ex Cha et al. 2016)]MDR6328404.1 hypothetical protein [Deinococcus soli (ex Cha et al. 2016)]MDR6753015.1 hypothetical protein [Deinococcus soli (ex Cha et al. 2016)]
MLSDHGRRLLKDLTAKWQREAREEPAGSPSHAVLRYCAEGLNTAVRRLNRPATAHVPEQLIAAIRRDTHLCSEDIGAVIDTRPDTHAALDPSMDRLLDVTVNVGRLELTWQAQAHLAAQSARHLEHLAAFIDAHAGLDGTQLPEMSAEAFARGVTSEAWWAALRPADLRALAAALMGAHTQDTPESVRAAMEAANTTSGRPSPVPQAEEQARFDVLNAGHEYREALSAARRLPELRAAFHGAQARLSAALDGAP